MSSKLTISVAVATLAASLGAYAAVPTGAAPFQVVVPNLKSGVEFTVTGLYLQPTNSDLDYVTTTTFTSGNSATNVTTLDPDYNLGFAVGLGYVFPDSGNDVQANWTHFSHSSDDSVVYPANTSSMEVFSRAGREFFNFSSLSASSSNDVKYDAVDLDVGQYLSIGTRLQTRLFAGLRYAQVKSDLTDTYVGANFITESSNLRPFADVENYNSKFTGIGPRFGVDATYHVGDCFGIVGHVAAALLVGRVETSTNLTFSASGINTSNVSITADNQTRVVPAFDAKLGVDYSVPFNNDASRLTFEAGYQVTQYIDAIDRLDTFFGNLPGSNNAISINSGTTRTTSSIGFNGPYLSINYKM